MSSSSVGAMSASLPPSFNCTGLFAMCTRGTGFSECAVTRLAGHLRDGKAGRVGQSIGLAHDEGGKGVVGVQVGPVRLRTAGLLGAGHPLPLLVLSLGMDAGPEADALGLAPGSGGTVQLVQKVLGDVFLGEGV